MREAQKKGIDISIVHKAREQSENCPDGIIEVDKSNKVIAALSEGKVGCGTAWLWAEDNSRETLDYLFVDEAGQMSLSHVLAASRATRNLILLGDPQQLEQPQKGAHPEGIGHFQRHGVCRNLTGTNTGYYFLYFRETFLQ